MTLTERLGNNGGPNKRMYSSARRLGGPVQAAPTEPTVEVEEIIARIRDASISELVTITDGNDALSVLTQPDTSAIVNVVARLVNREKNLPVGRAELIQRIVDDLIGTGPLQPLLDDASITEIMVNRFDRVFIEREGRVSQSGVTFDNDAHLLSVIQRIAGRVGRRVDESSPIVDARLADGSRVNAVIPPVALDGCSLTIRKFFVDRLSVNDLIQYETLSKDAANYLATCVAGKANVLISGGTGSGKTTTLNVMASCIPDDQRIVTIEDSAELQVNKPDVVRLESRPANVEGRGDVSIRDLVKNALRMRPDRIIVGEVRDGTAFDMLQAMNTGHDGSLTTVHANSADDAILRLESMVLMAGIDLPSSVIRQQIGSAVDIIVQQARLVDGRRRILGIHEVFIDDEGGLQIRAIFEFLAKPGAKGGYALLRTEAKSTLNGKLALSGLSFAEGLGL